MLPLLLSDVLSSSSHDSVCWECRDYGDLICCDACPRAFHAVCAKLDHIPVGEEPFVCGRCDDQHSENEEEGSDVDDIIDDTGVCNVCTFVLLILAVLSVSLQLTTEESVHAQMRPMQAMFELSGRLKEEWTRSKRTLDGATDARVPLPPVKVNLLTTRPVGIPVAPSSPPEVTVEASTIRSALLRPVTLAGQLHEALVKLVNQPDADFDRITAEIDPALFTSQALGPTEDALITQFVEREEASRSLKRTKVVPESQCEPGDGASQQTAPATSP